MPFELLVSFGLPFFPVFAGLIRDKLSQTDPPPGDAVGPEEVGGEFGVLAVLEHVVKFKSTVQVLVVGLGETKFIQDGSAVIEVVRIRSILVGLSRMGFCCPQSKLVQIKILRRIAFRRFHIPLLLL